MSETGSFRSVIELWPSREALAAEINAGASAVSKWWQRDNIPAEWWSPLLATERARMAGVSAEVMAVWASRSREEAAALSVDTLDEARA